MLLRLNARTISMGKTTLSIFLILNIRFRFQNETLSYCYFLSIFNIPMANSDNITNIKICPISTSIYGIRKSSMMSLYCNMYRNSTSNNAPKLKEVSKTFLLFVFLNDNAEMNVKNIATSKLIMWSIIL